MMWRSNTQMICASLFSVLIIAGGCASAQNPTKKQIAGTTGDRADSAANGPTTCEKKGFEPPFRQVVVNTEKWDTGLVISFDEPTTTRDGSKLRSLRHTAVYYSIQGQPGRPKLVTEVLAGAPQGGQHREVPPPPVPFSRVSGIAEELIKGNDVTAIFCARSFNRATDPQGDVSDPILVQFHPENLQPAR